MPNALMTPANIPESHGAQPEQVDRRRSDQRDRAGGQQDAQLRRSDADERHFEHSPSVRREIGLCRHQEKRRHHERGD